MAGCDWYNQRHRRRSRDCSQTAAAMAPFRFLGPKPRVPHRGLVSQFFDGELGDLERVLNPTLTNLDYLLGNRLRDWVIPVLHRESAQGQLVRGRKHTGSLPFDPLVPQHSINGHDCNYMKRARRCG